MKYSLMTMITFLFITFAHAQEQVVFNQIEALGTGCPAGTVRSSVSPDGTSLSVLFDEFRVEVPEHQAPEPPRTPGRYPRAPPTRPSKAMRDCQLRFTANLPLGTKVVSLEISSQARGATLFDAGIQGSFTSILVGYNGLSQSRGRPVPAIQKQWFGGVGGIMEEWIETPVVQIPINSGCAGAMGRGITFDMKNHLEAEILNGDLTKQGQVSVDSADATGMVKFKLILGRCGGVR